MDVTDHRPGIQEVRAGTAGGRIPTYISITAIRPHRGCSLGYLGPSGQAPETQGDSSGDHRKSFRLTPGAVVRACGTNTPPYLNFSLTSALDPVPRDFGFATQTLTHTVLIGCTLRAVGSRDPDLEIRSVQGSKERVKVLHKGAQSLSPSTHHPVRTRSGFPSPSLSRASLHPRSFL